MSLFIAISTCQRFEDNGWNDALRNTWLKDAKNLNVPYKFFVGQDGTPKEDVVVLPCGDDYHSLVYKTLEKYKWFMGTSHDGMFHCYHDTYVCVERLQIPEGVDYFGDYYHKDPRQPWPHFSYGNSCQAGQGVFLSRKAIEKVVEEFPKRIEENPPIREEDWWTGVSISKHPELIVQDTRNAVCNLTMNDPGPLKHNSVTSVHLSAVQPEKGKWDGQGRENEWKYRPEYMYRMYEEWKKSCEA